MNYKVVAGILFVLIIVVIIIVMAPLKENQEADHPKPDPEDPSQENSAVEILPPPDPAIELLASLSLEEKVGQLFIFGFQENKPSQRLRSLIQDSKIGGFILFQRNYQDIDSMIQLNQQLHTWNTDNTLPLWIAIDEEGGRVSRLPLGATKFPESRLLGNINDEDLTARVGEVIGKELRALGINLDFAPVMDIVPSKSNKLLYKRAYSGEAEAVAKHGTSFITGLGQGGVLGVPKHFPGHGDTQVDSHGGLPKIMIDQETLIHRELVPFSAAVAEGAEMIMVGHLAFPVIEEKALPATRSRIFLQDILRNGLGFDGVIVTDDLEMQGYANKNTAFEEALLQSFEAGIDLFVICHREELQSRAYNALLEAVETGKISEERLNASVLRTIRLKEKYDLSDYMYSNPEEKKKQVGTKEHKAVLQEVITRGKSGS
ncbi:beta-N-acetylhexosaminidase [Geosporobacter subterraneus DSM 17957]|uniref:Beta-N-acetylhexosaminidase n=1 Tax=Geosporobacter subterraneus DSM 17957 TaxID=1121919 RepID=A0A1M6P037_9FIRM|nr:beta-N-acetylhexosaminidase [Geosporobacter subterraneus]SHK01263.1 beta-N-acetylhexosaminidase [Geosporobacter subterraneus DSM 17957]